MKILHITDSHGTVKAPESRQDVYYISFLRKLYEVGMVAKALNVDMIVHTGDLFHTARVSDKFTGQVAELIKAANVPFYVVPGNHDIEGYTTDTIDQTKLGLLAKTGVITILDRDNPLKLTCNQNGEEYTVAISGQEYYAHIDEGNMSDFEMQQDPCDLNILAIHGYISDVAQHPDIKHTLCQDIVSDADIILTGHYHRQFEWCDGLNLDIYNPGSMMRVDQTEYNKKHTPTYGILDIHLDDQGYVVWDYQFHAFKTARPSSEVFDFNAKYQAKHASITLEGFKTSLANSMPQANMHTNNIPSIIHNICQNAAVDVPVEKKALDMYNLTLQTIPDEFEAPAGFIENLYPKKIHRVEIKNFQSHEDTTVVFDKGLNIIVGESNNGKTSILRAIMWAIDNQPLGTDFIMAGKDECKVTVVYDDGTYITRGRTLKDTGYYRVAYIDENGKMQTAEYRGFTNAIPIEVVNVHQMPKVNITKDIETHLNVASQLDPPFLITESPMTKASAIGRITGTHVLDAGVKDCNKTIQGNKKTIKVHADTIVEKDAELRALPDIDALEKVNAAYQAILKTIEAKYSAIEKVRSCQESIVDCEAKIAHWSDELCKKQGMAKFLPIVQRAQAKLQKHAFISYALTKHKDYEDTIVAMSNAIAVCRRIAKNEPDIKHAKMRIGNVQQVLDRYKAFLDVSNLMANWSQQAEMLRNRVMALSTIHAHCSLSMSFVGKVAPKMDAYNFCADNIKDAADNSAYAKKMAKATKTMITKTQKEQNSFVLQYGLCPCCGQPVADTSHSEAIVEFFKNNNTGG